MGKRKVGAHQLVAPTDEQRRAIAKAQASGLLDPNTYSFANAFPDGALQRHHGPSMLDYHPHGHFQAIDGVKKPWHSLPKKWPEFAPCTMIASGGRYVPFSPYDFQVDLIRTIRRCQNTYVLKSRQTGVSETVISYMLSMAITTPAWTGVVFSKTGDDASELAARIKGQASTLRERCPPLPKDSMRKLIFEGAGSLHFLPPTERAARGIPSASMILFDEAAFIDKLDGIETGAMPTLSMLGDRGRAVWVSTPNGRSGKFNDHWVTDHGEEIIDGTLLAGQPRLRISPDNQFAKVAIHYSQHPIYSKDPEWAAKTQRKRQLTNEKFRQEYELDFTASDHEIFSHEFIALAEEAGGLEPPQRSHAYYMGVDPNGGGDDQFCAVVVDATSSPWRAVAGFAVANCSRDYGLRLTAQLWDQYRPRLTFTESNGVGAAVAEALLIMRPTAKVDGFCTTEPSKVLITDRIVLMLERKELTIPPEHFIGAELRTFRQSAKGKREAAPGHHDDAVMALAFACQAAALERPMDSSWVRMV